ncbi:hypothetical protein AL036_08790 [Salipiger aestuarii]|uniref:hypothetical protein n=1 Tax=Salipiger aestuarii TaxID=568098 RepID=UPI00025B69D6|nr:hypothetical protein [Salipiger aestuarii]EIE51845.1 hypothetical protein C357_06834 [Citreicella sp. 357]KAA8608056.1 hypothetical protein AL036_08790 [Salipiger aestuarii]KAA8611449.1 hypothetical protein AL037_09720 [Salipiger aestuarii]
MPAYSLTKTRFVEGLWQGLLVAESAGASPPHITVTVQDAPVRGVTVTATPDPGRWAVDVPVPVQAVGDGVHTFLILDGASGEKLDSFTLIAGEAAGEDMRTEMALLRAELDMLKRAFRRHCTETG